MNNIFLTGPPGSGKTTLLFRTLRSLQAMAHPAAEPVIGGFVVKRVFRKRRRVALDLVCLSTGRRGRLVDSSLPSGPVVERAVFLDIGVPALDRALRHATIVVMDELGRFELEVEPFLAAVETVLDSPKLVVGVIKAESNPFLDRIRSRPDVELIPVSPEQREAAGVALRDILSRWTPHGPSAL